MGIKRTINKIKNKLERVIREESVIMLFPSMDEFNNKVLPYITKNYTDSEMRQGGVIITAKSNIPQFKAMGFNFSFADVKDKKKFYLEHSRELEDYANQVRRFYGLPKRDVHID